MLAVTLAEAPAESFLLALFTQGALRMESPRNTERLRWREARTYCCTFRGDQVACTTALS